MFTHGVILFYFIDRHLLSEGFLVVGIGYELLLFDALDEVDGLLHFHLPNVANMFIQQNVVATVKLELVEKVTLQEGMTFLK